MGMARLGAAVRQIQTLFDSGGGVAGLTDAQLLDRFVTRRDEAAFKAIVERHGRTVLAACRSVLRNPSDAEDAFQATFLVLVRKARTIWVGDSLACWLYKVARRIAVQANVDASRRREVEGRAGAMRGPIAGRDESDDDRRALHEEIARLPEKFRAPILLCDIEERTRDEAAGHLGWSAGTVASRLARGRALLRDRLARRGFASVAGPAALLAACRAEAAVPEAWIGSTVEAAMAVAAGGAVVAGSSSTAVALSERGVRAMLVLKLKIVATAALAAAGLLWVGNPLLSSDGKPADPAMKAKPVVEARPPAAAPADVAGTIAVAGRVVGSDGKPVAGARVDVIAKRQRHAGDIGDFERSRRVGTATADVEGRFRLDVPRPATPLDDLVAMAGAPGRGLDGASLKLDATSHDVTITMDPERPIRGRLVDIQGQPARGVTLRIPKVSVRDVGYPLIEPGSPWPGPATTDDRGRFTFRGLGPRAAFEVEVADERFARQDLKFEAGDDGRAAEKTLALAPAQTIEVRVTYDDGRPVAGAWVNATASHKAMPGKTTGARADDQGRARVSPWPGDGYRVTAYPPEGQPYRSRMDDINWPSASPRQSVEIKLKPGVAVRGRVAEADGKPVSGARVYYFQVYRANKLYDDSGNSAEVATGADGSFAMAVPPGPGDLLVRGPSADYVHVRTSFNALGSGIQPSFPMYPDALAHIDPKPGAKEQTVAFTLTRGVTVRCRVVDPEGKPVADAIAIGRTYVPYSEHRFAFIAFNGGAPTLRVRDGKLDVPGVDPKAPATFYLLDARRQLGATAIISAATAKDGPVVIKLQPCGSARVRYRDKDGKPVADRGMIDLALILTPGAEFNNESILAAKPLADMEFQTNLDPGRNRAARTDAEGTFTYASLIPGAPYRLKDREFIVEPGQTIDLGAVVSPGEE